MPSVGSTLGKMKCMRRGKACTGRALHFGRSSQAQAGYLAQLLGSQLHDVSGRRRRTRAEFEDWARALAAEHGYAVSFDSVGHAVGEAAALAAPALRGSPDLGAATQVRSGRAGTWRW